MRRLQPDRRTSALRPALRATVHCRRMSARGEAWQLLSAPESRQQLRIVGGIYRVAHQRAAQGVPEPAGSGRVPHHAIDFFHPLSKR